MQTGKSIIFLMDYEGACSTFYGSMAEAIKHFVSRDEYWKVIVDGNVIISRGTSSNTLNPTEEQ